MDARWSWRDAAGWAALAATLLVGFSGAASVPDGVRYGGLSLVPALLAATVVSLAWAVGGTARGRIGLGALPLLLAALLAPWFPALRFLTGQPLAALALGVAVAAAAHRRPRWEARLFLPVIAAVYAFGAWHVQRAVGPEGDEPHYLVVADSILRDGDVEVGSDFEAGRYRPFHPRAIEPHYRVRGKDGRIYSLHAVGLSWLILPAYAAFGYAGASFFMAGLAAWLALETRKLVRDATRRFDVGAGVGWLAAFSPPLLHYVGLVFTEIPAALVVALGLRHVVVRPLVGGGRAWALAAALAYLPWLNVRYAPLAALLLLVAVLRGGSVRNAVRWVLPSVVSAVAIMAWHQSIYGFPDPRHVYGRRVEMDPASIPSHLPGVFLDQEFGLFVYAPFLVLAVAGLALPVLKPRVRATAGVLVLAAVLITASWPMWRGGFNPPARFLVPVVAPLTTAAAAAVVPGLGPGAALLAGWGLWTGLSGVAHPELVHRDRDGGAPLFRVTSGAGEWTRILPGWVLDEDRPPAARLSAVWAALLALALVPLLRRRIGPGTVAAAQGAVVIVVLLASRLAMAPPVAREATRLAGQTAVWGPEALLWGPLYEPHRHPDGAVLAARLALPVGHYAVEIVGERHGTEEPAVEVEPEPRAQRRMAPGGIFAVKDGERAVTLRLRGGAPLSVERILLRPVQP